MVVHSQLCGAVCRLYKWTMPCPAAMQVIASSYRYCYMLDHGVWGYRIKCLCGHCMTASYCEWYTAFDTQHSAVEHLTTWLFVQFHLVIWIWQHQRIYQIWWWQYSRKQGQLSKKSYKELLKPTSGLHEVDHFSTGHKLPEAGNVNSTHRKNKKDGYRQQNVRQRQKLISIIDYDVCMTFY